MDSRSQLLTIGLPVYNGVEFLEKTIKSILKQTFSDFTLVISDNASTDGSGVICRRYRKTDERIRYYRQKKTLSATDNFNFLLKITQTEYFAWVASDDVIHKDYLKSAILMFRSLPANTPFVACRSAIIDSKGNVVSRKKTSYANYSRGQLDFTRYLRESFFHFKANIFYSVYRTEILKKIGGIRPYPALAAGDILTILHLLSCGNGYIIPKTLLYKREPVFFDKYTDKVPTWYLLIIDLIKTLSRMLIWTAQNLTGSNFRYIMSNILIYHRTVYGFIAKYPRTKRFFLKIVTAYSAFNLFLTLLPNSIDRLKKRNAANS